MLFNYYSNILNGNVTIDLIKRYVDNGSKEFEEAIKNETNSNINQILNATLPDGETVKTSILRQITK